MATYEDFQDLVDYWGSPYGDARRRDRRIRAARGDPFAIVEALRDMRVSAASPTHLFLPRLTAAFDHSAGAADAFVALAAFRMNMPTSSATPVRAAQDLARLARNADTMVADRLIAALHTVGPRRGPLDLSAMVLTMLGESPDPRDSLPERFDRTTPEGCVAYEDEVRFPLSIAMLWRECLENGADPRHRGRFVRRRIAIRDAQRRADAQAGRATEMLVSAAEDLEAHSGYGED